MNSYLDAEDIRFLRQIAVKGGMNGPINVSTNELGEMLGVSQQTASRRIVQLEQENQITRTSSTTGQFILITDFGIETLRREYAVYKNIFGDKNRTYFLKGTVVSGVGEGRYYMSIPHYQEMFTDICGFVPYQGTLNIRLNPQSMQIRSRIESLDWTVIPGFRDEHRQFGDARCLKCTISDIPCAIVAPLRTHHPTEIIEVISGDRLRDRLNLIDGTQVDVVID